MPSGKIVSIAGAASAFLLLAGAVSAQVPRPTFNPVVIETKMSGPWGKSMGDIDADGDIDLLVQANYGGGLAWYRNPGWTKTIISLADGGFRTDMEVADVNNDGRADVVSMLGNRVVWFEQPASGPLTTDWPLRAIGNRVMHDLEVADLDGNRLLDVVARNQSAFGGESRNIYLYAQTSPGVFTERALDVGVNGEGLLLVDIDRDGRLDIAANGRWLRNPGGGSDPWPVSVYSNTWTELDAYVASGDINGDGRVDLVLSPAEAGENNYRISWFEAPADPRSLWQERIVEPSIQTLVHFVGVGDFNRDGWMDIASAEMPQSDNNDEVAIYLNERGAGWSKSVIWNQGSHSMRVGDFDNDGDPDLFGANWNNESGPDESVRVWYNTTPGLHIIFSQKPEARRAPARRGWFFPAGFEYFNLLGRYFPFLD